MADNQNSLGGTFSEKMRLIRFRRKKEHTRFRDELRIIPRWLIVSVIVLFLVAQAVGFVGNLSFHAFGEGAGAGQVWPPEFQNNPALAALIVAGIITAASLPLAAFIFLLGYVNRDAKRRGMHSGLWTLLVMILSPAWLAMGFIIYFLVREPLPYNCPQCGHVVGPRFNFCPNCKNNLHRSCPQCKREVDESDKFCPNCAYELAAPASVSLPVTSTVD